MHSIPIIKDFVGLPTVVRTNQSPYLNIWKAENNYCWWFNWNHTLNFQLVTRFMLKKQHFLYFVFVNKQNNDSCLLSIK